jgi:hypothetical protein
MEVEHILIQECFVAEFTVQLFFRGFDIFSLLVLLLRYFCFAEYPRNKLLPAKKRPLFPLLLKHFFSLVVDLSKLNQRIGPLEEVF